MSDKALLIAGGLLAFLSVLVIVTIGSSLAILSGK